MQDKPVHRLLVFIPLSPGVLVYLAPWVACPLGVKIPWGILPPTLGSLPPRGEAASGHFAPGGEDTLAWAACPPPQENLTELNAERFFFFFK